MGRPLKKKYFGNTNLGLDGEGVGGEGVASVAIASPIAKSYTEAAIATFSAPQVPGGETATGTVTIDENGDIEAVVVVGSGSGYTSRPTVTISEDGQSNTVLTHGAGGVTVTLNATTTRGDAILARGIPITGGSGTDVCDIVEQDNDRCYKIRSSLGTAVCQLVTDGAANAVGEMTISAYDSSGAAYWVKKLTARKAVLVRQSAGVGQFADPAVYPDGQPVKWVLGSTATENVSVYLETAA